MKRLLTIILCLLGILAPAVGKPAAHQSRPAATLEVPTVAFCDLLKNPQAYDGRVIRTRAVFSRRGEEVTEFYCPTCSVSGGVDFDPSGEEYESCTKPPVREKILNYPTVNVTLTGRFVAAGPGEGFGHMGLWRYRLVVSCVEKAEVISKHELSPDDLPKRVQRRAACM